MKQREENLEPFSASAGAGCEFEFISGQTELRTTDINRSTVKSAQLFHQQKHFAFIWLGYLDLRVYSPLPCTWLSVFLSEVTTYF